MSRITFISKLASISTSRGAPELSSGRLVPAGTKILPELSNRPELSILGGRNPITGQQVIYLIFISIPFYSYVFIDL